MVSSEPIIRCEHVDLAYGRRVVVQDACLDIPRGILLPFIGPNGAGKTTLLRAILGLLTPLRGRILTPFAEKPAGYVPQQKAIDPHYPVTARQIIEMGLYPELGWWKRPGPEQRRRILAVLERFGLADHQQKTFGELSGGMKQKTLLARAWVSDAEVFVLDEPTSELDEESERDVLAHLLRLAQAEGKTVLLAHHGLEQAATLAERVCLVRHGRVQLTIMPDARRILGAASHPGGSSRA